MASIRRAGRKGSGASLAVAKERTGSRARPRKDTGRDGRNAQLSSPLRVCCEKWATGRRGEVNDKREEKHSKESQYRAAAILTPVKGIPF